VDPSGLAPAEISLDNGHIIIDYAHATRDQANTVAKAIQHVLSTKRGKELSKKFSKAHPWVVELNFKGSDCPVVTAFDKDKNELIGTFVGTGYNHNPIYKVQIQIGNQVITEYPSYERLLGHEEAHAALNKPDSVVIPVENQIMNDPAMNGIDPGNRVFDPNASW
jgi:hypothetical protein